MKQPFTYFIGSRSLFLFAWFFVTLIGTVQAASTTFSSGVLTISFSADNENTQLLNNGTNITVLSNMPITGAGAAFSTASVTKIIVNDPDDLASQTLTFSAGTAFTLSGGLDVSGVEYANFSNSVTVTGSSSIVVIAKQSILISGVTLTGGGGGVQLKGEGTLAVNNIGVELTSGALVTASGVGSVFVEGKGDDPGFGYNVGVQLFGPNAKITSSGGPVTVKGTGGLAFSSKGVYVRSGGEISAGGLGLVNVEGQSGANLGGDCDGVSVDDLNSKITSSGGDVTVKGTSMGLGGNKNYGVVVSNGGEISAGSAGNVNIEGLGGMGTIGGDAGVYLVNSAKITSSGGNVVVKGYGRGGATTAFNIGVIVYFGGVLTAGGMGSVYVEGQGGNTTGGRNSGVEVTGSGAKITSSGGDVSVKGLGGTSSLSIGVSVSSAGEINASGSGKVNVDGQGGSTGNQNYGVYVTGSNSKISSSGGSVEVNGTGGGSGTSHSNYGVMVLAFGEISAGGMGTVKVVGKGGNTAGTGGDSNYGVYVVSSSKITSSGGNVSVVGSGGGSGAALDNIGVLVLGGSFIGAGNLGSVNVEGQGGNNVDDRSYGVYVSGANSLITSSGGNVVVKGTGGASSLSGASSNTGVVVDQAGAITAASTGTVSVEGQGGNSPGGDNTGVVVTGASSKITSSGGNVLVKGTGSLIGSFSRGVNVTSSGQINAGGTGTLNVEGKGGNDPAGANIGVSVSGNNSLITSLGGNVLVKGLGGVGGTGVNVANGGRISAGSMGSVSVDGLGGSTDNYGVRVSDSNTQITSSGGPILVKGTGTGSQADIWIEFGGVILSPSTSNGITLQSTNNGTWPNTDNIDVSTSSTQKTAFTAGSKLNIVINYLVADAGYQQLDVVGMIDLSGVELTFAGSTAVLGVGSILTIVNNDDTDPVIGSFNGLPEGAFIPNFLGTGLNAQITYVGGSGNDVVLRVVAVTAGVTIAQSGGTTNVAEGGATDTYTVVLTSQPSSDVTITPTPNAQVTSSPASLVFTSANWNVAQTVTVTAVDDSAVEGSHAGTITHSASSSSANYNNITIASVTANITDNDVAATAGVSITQSGGTTDVAEGGATDTYTIVLASQPSADVTITMTPNAQITTSPVSVVFTSANWNTPQTVTVTAVNDAIVEGSHTGNLAHSAASADANYNNITIAVITANISDNDNVIIENNDCACQDVTVSLDNKCQFVLTGNLVSDANCNGGTVRVMDNNPSNGNIIDCAGVWTYGLFDAFGNVICWGKVTAEDKRAPELLCAPADVTLDCYDVNYVLNNHLTIGNYGYLPSPRPAANDPARRTITNAEGVAGTGDNCQLGLVPPALVNDNIKNLGYAHFRDTCRDCGCRINLKWSDRVVYYSCTDIEFTRNGYYAKIERQWVATDCNGMSSSFVQDIFFKRPALSAFVFKDQKKEGKYDQVVTYNSCTPDKSLIKKEDVTPYHCSYFNTADNPRCLYLDQVECNYSVTTKDTEFPICGGKGVKIDREMYIFDWCKGGIVDTLHILIKIGDFEAPALEYAHHAPYDISTGPMDCTAAIPVTPAGIKSQFGVTIKDNCTLGNIGVSIKTKDRYVKGILVAENVWEKVDYAVMNGMMIGLPVGKHRLIIDASDGCYNAKKDSFIFEVKDKIAPVMKCDDDLHVTLSNANGYTNGYAQVSAADIDEGSWDNCKLAWTSVRRNVPASCEASFVQKGYDSNGNNKLDAAPFEHPKDAPANFDWNSVDGVDLNGDGDISDFGEFVTTKGGKKMTPMLDFVEFFCCDLTERVTVELWGADTADDPKTLADETNYNYCWMDLLIEDKVAPTCIAPWDVTIDCDDKNIGLIDDKVASSKLWGDVTITTGNDCGALDTVYTTTKTLKCGYGKIVRSWALTKQTAKGPITITCSQTIWVRPIHQYDICFPKDASTDCKTPSPDTVLVNEHSCDLLAVNVSDKRYDATGDECYKIFRTYTVINWCAYDDKCGDPMAEGNVFVVDRGLFQNNGAAPIYVLVRDDDRDLNEEFYLSTNLTANEQLATNKRSGDYHVLGDGDRNGDADGTGYRSTDYSQFAGKQVTMPRCEAYDLSTDYFQSWEYYHSFMYTQIIKVYDDTRPVVTGVRDTFCTSPSLCTANIVKVVNLKDNCSDKVTLETQYLMIAPFQTTDAGKMILYSAPRWSTRDLGNGNYEISVTNLPEGTHDLIVVGRDECGNLSVATRIPFTVKDCKAPAPICINGLSTGIMPDGNGGGMMAVWATDFVASKIYDCNGQGPETKDGLKLITKYSINRVGQAVNKDQTGLNFTCADINNSPILVELHAWDEAGNHDFCITFVELIDSRGVCAGSATLSIAGTIATEGNAKLQGASITLSGSASQSATSTANGGYAFLNLSRGGDFTVTPQLDKNHLNGVSTFDLVLIQKHILGIQALNSPYKMIAADVNNSKSISTLDLIALRKLILNIDSHFANNTSWRFVDAAYQFPQATNPWAAAFPEVVSVNDIATNVTANFIAIKVGDVNASASVNNAAASEIRTSNNFELKTQEQNLKAGNEYKVSFSAEDLKNIQGYQFALNLDQSKVELLDMEYGVAKAENFGIFKSEGIITTSWNGKYEAGAMFSLILRAKADAKLSQSITLNRLVAPEAYDQNSEYLGIKLNFEGDQISDSYELKQNTPNPFNAETNIGFTLPKAAKATLTIRDVKGALVYKVEGNYTKGNNQITLKKEQLRASGVLYYTLETNDFTASKKMVLLQE